MTTYYLYRLQESILFDKCGATNNWDQRCTDNRREHGSQCIITLLETMEGPNTPEYWQIVGDREWELADEYGYPRGTHYRRARERRQPWNSVTSTKAAITRRRNGNHRNGGLAHKGKPKTEAWKSKKPWLKSHEAHAVKTECPHCSKSIDQRNYGRWHGDNCKLNPKKGQDFS